MDKYIYNEKNGLWYELQGDYYIPCLELPAEKEGRHIGVWGQRHLRYIFNVMLAYRNKLIAQGRYTGIVDEVMIKFAKWAYGGREKFLPLFSVQKTCKKSYNRCETFSALIRLISEGDKNTPFGKEKVNG